MSSASETASIVVTCVCGAKVRVPASVGGRSFRCPKCKADFATTSDSQVIASYRIRPGESATVCPICQTGIQPQEEAINCPGCGQVHHRECWVEVGGCSTYGCRQAPSAEKDAAEPPTTAWGDTKNCPVCGETIKSIAVVCRYCQTRFDSVDPLTLRDLHRRTNKQEGQRKLQTWSILLFGASVVLGLLAPIMLLVNILWLLAKRKDLSAAGPVYLVLGYSAIGVAALYSFLMLVFFLFSH
ncbi:MAG TPA: RING finger protein [Pirellulales bacterium]|nr:RING finger protein [Pirellulales bacterium]